MSCRCLDYSRNGRSGGRPWLRLTGADEKSNELKSAREFKLACYEHRFVRVGRLGVPVGLLLDHQVGSSISCRQTTIQHNGVPTLQPIAIELGHGSIEQTNEVE